MRLGGPVDNSDRDPIRWAAEARRAGYRAVYCPLEATASDDEIRAYAEAARDADLVIAEVGAWSNPMSPDEGTRRAAIDRCRTQLALADRIGARCCVNIAGSCGEQWDGHHPDNLTADTFDRVVETTRSIIDAVKPTRTFYSLETMPWMLPDSAKSYERLLRAIDRRGFAVHLDPVNLICSPQLYYGNAVLIRECFARLGPHIKSCHAKDILLSGRLTVHLDEVRPGLGGLDYGVLIDELCRLDSDTPLMLEHLPAEEYPPAAAYITSVAQGRGIDLS